MSVDIERVDRLVARAVFGDRDGKLLRYEKLETPSSLVFCLEYAIDGASESLFVKCPAEGRAHKTIQRLQSEFRLTERVKGALRTDPELETVSPVVFIDEINGFVTRGVRGDSLQDLISSELRFRYRRVSPELSRLARLAGLWLRRFHSLNLVEGMVDVREIVSTYCENRIEVLAQTKNSQITNSLAESLKHNVSTWIDEALSSPGARTVLCHNDFSPHNIIATNRGICVLDYSFSTAGLPAFDLACFWHKLEDLKGSWVRGRKGLQQMQDCFLDGYGSGFDMSRPDVKLGLARLVLSKMLTLLDSRSVGLYSWIESRRRYSNYLALIESGFE